MKNIPESYGQCKQWRRKSCQTRGGRVTLGAGLCEWCWDKKTDKQRDKESRNEV